MMRAAIISMNVIATRVSAAPQARASISLATPRISWERVIRTTVGLRPHRDSGFVLKPEKFDVVGSVSGNATTDFGAPGVEAPWDVDVITTRELQRQVTVLADCWAYFDGVVANAPATLRKGPRGGGRDRDAVVAHVREAERHYCSKLGTRVPPRTPWTEQRAVVTGSLLAGSPQGTWPPRYSLRRLAWHVLDHAWEIEDKSE